MTKLHKAKLRRLIAEPMAIRLKDEVIADKGDYLLIDTDTGHVQAVGPDEYKALYMVNGTGAKRKSSGQRKMLTREERKQLDDAILVTLAKANGKALLLGDIVKELKPKTDRQYQAISNRLLARSDLTQNGWVRTLKKDGSHNQYVATATGLRQAARLSR